MDIQQAAKTVESALTMQEGHPLYPGSEAAAEAWLTIRNRLGMDVVIDPGAPKDEISFHQNGQEVGRIVNIGKTEPCVPARDTHIMLLLGAIGAQEAMIQALVEPLGCPPPYDNHAVEWLADQYIAIRKERDDLQTSLDNWRDAAQHGE